MRMSELAGALFGAGLAMTSGPALAQGAWVSGEGFAGYEATADDGAARRLEVLCMPVGPSLALTLNYTFPADELATALQDIERQYLAVVLDQRDGVTTEPWTAGAHFDHVRDGRIGIGFADDGTVAEIARKIGRARESVLVGVSTVPSGEDLSLHNAARFSAAGSGAAMRSVLAACDVTY